MRQQSPLVGYIILGLLALYALSSIDKYGGIPGPTPPEYKGRPYFELYDRGTKWLNGSETAETHATAGEKPAKKK